MSPLTPNMVKR